MCDESDGDDGLCGRRECLVRVGDADQMALPSIASEKGKFGKYEAALR
jgi:hypothetical protein